MPSLELKPSFLKSALAATALLLGSGAALAQQQINLTAGFANATLPDGNQVPMWGYTCGIIVSGSQATCAAANPAAVMTPASTSAAAVMSGWSPVVITVPTGQSLQINLTNSLPGGVPTSLTIVGQLGGGIGAPGSTTLSPDHTNAQTVTWPIADPTTSGAPPAQGTRVQSFGTEALNGNTATLCWGTCSGVLQATPLPKAGTYLIESGTHPSIQGPMGLYGILVVTTAPNGTTAGTAYGTAGSATAVSYSADIPLLLSEIDPLQNTAVNTAANTAGFMETNVWAGFTGLNNSISLCKTVGGGSANPGTCYPPAVNYTPLYYLINGVAFSKPNGAASLFPVAPATGVAAGANLLVRVVNAGLRMHVPSIVGSQTGTASGFSLIAEDGNVLPGVPRVQSEVFMAAGKTYDLMVSVPAAAAALPIYDRELSLSAGATARDAGMLAYIGINGGALPITGVFAAVAAHANSDAYSALVSGQTLVVADPAKGVIGNDVNVLGVALDTTVPVVGGTVHLNPNGTFTFAATATTGSFGYCANGAAPGDVNLCTTVALTASSVNTDTVTCTAPAFPTSNIATYLAVKPPGVLGGCTDGAGLPLSVAGATATTPLTVAMSPSGTATIDANGGFTASVTAGGAYMFSFQAQNSLGTATSTATTVTINLLAANGPNFTVLDGADKKTVITDYRWVIEEDQTFFVDPMCTVTTATPALGCPTTATGSPLTFGTNFHTSHMPLVATGCTGRLSCEVGQTLLGVPAVCDIGNGVCRTDAAQQTAVTPDKVHLDPTKRYYISVLPGDAANPFIGGNGSPPANCILGPYAPTTTDPYNLNTDCGHGMGGAAIPAPCRTGVTCASTAFADVKILTQPAPYQTATLTVFVFEDDFPLNGEHDAGGGVDVIAPNEQGLGGFQVTIFDDAGGTGDSTGQPTYDMFNMPLSNSLAGSVDPVTNLDACPLSPIVTANALLKGNAATPAQCSNDPTLKSCQKGIVGMIVTCPKYESDGKTLSPLAGQAVVKNLWQGRYGIVATPGADRIGRGEEWLQTNTLDGQKAHDSFMRIAEPAYFQEFGPAGYHVTIGFANPQIINDRRTNTAGTGMCDSRPRGGGQSCPNQVKGHVTTARMSRSPDQRLYGSGTRDIFAFTQCFVSLGEPDGADFAFTKCDADGNFAFTKIPAGNYKVTVFDQWNDQIVDGISQPVGVGSPVNSTTCGAGSTTTICNMGEIAAHQWQTNISTRTFIDDDGSGIATGVSTDAKAGLALVATNIRFRDGSFSNFNNTDLAGNAGFNEVFPLFNWYVIETDSTRYKTTGVHVVYDSGGPVDVASGGCAAANAPVPCGHSGIGLHMANTYEPNPLPPELSVPGAVYCTGADCATESIAGGPVRSSTSNHSTGRIDPPFWFGSYGWQSFPGQNAFLEWGKKPYADTETGGIHGHVVYASTRPFDDPQLLLQLSWEPLIPHVRINLYKKDVATDGVTPTLTLIDHTDTSSFDDWAQGFRSDNVPNMNCPGQSQSDLFFYALKNQPQYLEYYNSVHGGPAPHTMPNNAQFKCYDGMHNWVQLQPAPYDGMYSFPSITGFDPTSGEPTGTNCTTCVFNPDASDPYRFGNNNTGTWTPGTGHGTPMLPAGTYVVEVVVPPGYELVKEEDKNILIGDNYIAPAVQQFGGLGSIYILPDQAQIAANYNPNNAQNPTTALGVVPRHEGDTGSVEMFWPCVGASRTVPDYISLFPESAEVAPFAGATRALCDRKEVALNVQSAALVKFYLFTSTHVASHFTGLITDDFTAEFDPFSPQFGEKFAPAYLPVAVKDWAGNEISRVYSDQFGAYNGLSYSTWEVNPPNPTGYGPTMMVTCMNDRGTGANPDPNFQANYSQFCYELPFMPGQTGYFDTPVVPTSAFSEGFNHPDCSYPDATPAIASVVNTNAEGSLPAGSGPWVSASGTGHTLTINALPDQQVDNYGYTGPSNPNAPFNAQRVNRHFGFGQATGTVKIGGVTATLVGTWNDTKLTVTVPANVPTCPVQQQRQFGGPASTAANARCGELVVTTAAGRASVDTVTVTIGGKRPILVQSGGADPVCMNNPTGVQGPFGSVQHAIDCASPGDMILVGPGVYSEILLMWKPVRLQGIGAVGSIIDGDAHPAGKLDPWRTRVNCLFGLTPDGRPRPVADNSCTAGWNFASGGLNASSSTGTNFQTMIVDRLPFEATLGWDATLNGNLAEQLLEPSLFGAYEGATVTVLGKGVTFPTGTNINDAFGASTGAAFPDNTTLLTGSTSASSGCGSNTAASHNRYPTNFYCNPSSIDALGIRNSSQGGGGIFVHAFGHYLQIANNRIYNNIGTVNGGIAIGQGEHPDVNVGGFGATPTTFPTSCEFSFLPVGLPFCYDTHVNIHNNAITLNSAEGDELFSSTGAGAGGVMINTGSDYYQLTNNWICGNLNTGDGGGVSHVGFTKNGDIEHNTIIFNQSTNPTITTNGGGLLVMGAPDLDPTCGANTDQDCAPTANTVTPGDGTGPGTVINANLILGNAAEAGSGGGLRLQHVNGTDIINLPAGTLFCTLPSTCAWNQVSVTNNIIANNVAGWDGGGVSMLDALAVNLFNNTIISNDSTASAGALFQSLFAPLASAPGTNCTKAAGTQSCAQPAGLVSDINTAILRANLPATGGTFGFSCPYPTLTNFSTACRNFSNAVLDNNIFWHNRSMFISVSAPVAGETSQQNTVTLFNASFVQSGTPPAATPVASQPQGDATSANGSGFIITGGMGACVAPTGQTLANASNYWDIGVRGDSSPFIHVSLGGSMLRHTPNYSVVTNTAAYPAAAVGNTMSDPTVNRQYCNGSRVPPEAGPNAVWGVPPGTIETNGLPHPVFNLTASATVDEGNNWINMRWGPLALSNVTVVGGTNGNQGGGPSLGDYGIPASGSAFNHIPSTSGQYYTLAPGTDFYGNKRKTGATGAVDAGAVEFGATP
jgi:hypothetical protein